jgi:hypothetical protein
LQVNGVMTGRSAVRTAGANVGDQRVYCCGCRRVRRRMGGRRPARRCGTRSSRVVALHAGGAGLADGEGLGPDHGEHLELA